MYLLKLFCRTVQANSVKMIRGANFENRTVSGVPLIYYLIYLDFFQFRWENVFTEWKQGVFCLDRLINL